MESTGKTEKNSVLSLIDVLAHLEPFFGHRQHIPLACCPHILRWQQKDAHDEGCDQTSDDNDCERALRIRTDGVRESGRQQS